MAEGKEIVYNIPLKFDVHKSPKDRRAPRAVNVIREYVRKHAKVREVTISRGINEAMWARGIKRPPSALKVKVRKDGDSAKAMLIEEIDISEAIRKEAKGRIAKLKRKLALKQKAGAKEAPEVAESKAPEAEKKE